MFIEDSEGQVLLKKHAVCLKNYMYFFSLWWEWCHLNKIFKCMSIIFISLKVWFKVRYTVYTKIWPWFSKCLLQHCSGIGRHTPPFPNSTDFASNNIETDSNSQRPPLSICWRSNLAHCPLWPRVHALPQTAQTGTGTPWVCSRS